MNFDYCWLPSSPSSDCSPFFVVIHRDGLHNFTALGIDREVLFAAVGCDHFEVVKRRSTIRADEIQTDNLPARLRFRILDGLSRTYLRSHDCLGIPGVRVVCPFSSLELA